MSCTLKKIREKKKILKKRKKKKTEYQSFDIQVIIDNFLCC